jgi:acyl-CoA synthetase (NDP forming)
VVYVPTVETNGSAHAAALRSALSQATMPVLTTFPITIGGDAERGSVPSFRTPERAVAALAHAVQYGRWLTSPAGTVPDLPGIDGDAARGLLAEFHEPGRATRALTDGEVVRLLACYGIPLVDYRAVGTRAEVLAAAEAVGYPVALKSFDDSFRHRMDHEGVRIGLVTPEQLTAAYDELSSVAGPRLEVQAMAPRDRSDVSTVFAISADPSFGVLVSFGIGGVATELLDDRAYRAVPLTDVDAAHLISAPRAAPLLNGYRGTRVVAREALIDLALRLSALADDLPEVSELELRPVLAGPAGVAVTSASCRIAPAVAQPDAVRRLL